MKTAGFLEISKHTFQSYRVIGEKAMNQVSDEGLFWVPGEEVNSIAILVNHLAGNMLSRWTDFLTTDGEKPWRDRDAEFEAILQTRSDVTDRWTEGWECLFSTLESLTESDLERIIYIRAEPHTVKQALTRQLAHYAYHVGQLVLLARIMAGTNWQSLSIPKGGSDQFNREKMG